jgi:HK97 family phage portal protein
MGLLNFFRKQRIPVEKKSSEIVWPIPQGSFLEYAFGEYGRLSDQKAMGFYRTNSTVATAVDKIARKVEQIEPVLEKTDGTLITEHAILDLINDPNPFDTRQEFIGKLVRSYLITADSYLSMFGNTERPPLELYVLKPQNVSNVQGVDYFPASYYVTVGPGVGNYLRVSQKKAVRYIDQNFKELYHIMGFSSRADELSGDSPLEAAALETRQQIEGRTHNLKLLKNGGRLSLIVAFNDEDGIDGDEHLERKKRVNEELGGSENAGGIAVISGSEVTLKEAGINNKDMDYAELDKVASEAIYLRYEIPLPLVSTDASTYNNVENALLDFYENTILPTTDTVYAGLSKALMHRFKIDDMRLTYNPESIKVLMRQQIRELVDRRKLNIETINELRALLPNRESLGNEADILYQPATMVPISEDLFTDDNMTPEQLAELLKKKENE